MEYYGSMVKIPGKCARSFPVAEQTPKLSTLFI